MELVVERLRSTYGDLVAVDDVSLHVRAGQVVAIVGPNGCGKSTLLRSIARLHRPQRGKVLLNGEDLWALRPKEAARRVALLPQSPQAPEAMTVWDLVRFGRHPHQGLFHQWSKEDARACQAAMELTGTTRLAHRLLDQLSGGQRQLGWLAMVLAQETPVILLDEPTSMLDLGHQVEVLSLVRDLAARSGRMVIMVLHDLSAAARFADVLVAMRDGRVVAAGPPQLIVDADLVRQLYDVEADVLPAPGSGAPVVVAQPRRQPALSLV